MAYIPAINRNGNRRLTMKKGRSYLRSPPSLFFCENFCHINLNLNVRGHKNSKTPQRVKEWHPKDFYSGYSPLFMNLFVLGFFCFCFFFFLIWTYIFWYNALIRPSFPPFFVHTMHCLWYLAVYWTGNVLRFCADVSAITFREIWSLTWLAPRNTSAVRWEIDGWSHLWARVTHRDQVQQLCQHLWG